MYRELTPEQAAVVLGATRRDVARWCAMGLLPGAHKVGPRGKRGLWMIPESALQGFVRPRRGRKPRAKVTE